MAKREEIYDRETKLDKLAFLLGRNGITIFEYKKAKDILTIYNEKSNAFHEISDFTDYLTAKKVIYPDDLWKTMEFYQGKINAPLEIRVLTENGQLMRKVLDAVTIEETSDDFCLIGCTWNVTEAKKQEELLEERAKRDTMTGLYNHFDGKMLINQYLEEKDPYTSCGMMVLDIDFFKNVNDTYGHLFGDDVLVKLASTLKLIFDRNDILVRAGGDEFVILLKGINHTMLLKKAMQLVESVRKIPFEGTDYCMTCSVGVCFLPENVAGYSYDQLFENADWALYKAKENGKNQYAFCDTLRKFEIELSESAQMEPLDARYLRNDVISTAFELFEKSSSFEMAMELLLKVIGIRFQLDRITVIQTDINSKNTSRQFQWVKEGCPEALTVNSSFEKEDFLTLFQSYDEFGTTVLQYDNMGMYSEGAQKLLIQGDTKTVLYAAMYCEGKYTGAISYVVCGNKRYWSRQNRRELGELTKIVSAHLAKHQAMNLFNINLLSVPEFDQLTGLLSFSKFKEEAERLIVGGYAEEHILIYTDFENFKFFNQKYGYSKGDELLKEFSREIVNGLKSFNSVYFTRIVADQFALFFPYTGEPQLAEAMVDRINREIIAHQLEKFPDANFKIRSGIYYVGSDCHSASEALDAANYARLQLTGNPEKTAVVFDASLAKKRRIENEIINGMSAAMEKKEFQVYLQPKFSFEDLSVTGAEALVRWVKPNGEIFYPDSFIPLYETNRRIIELDYYVMEQAAQFLAENKKQGRREIPIAVNISALHASYPETADRIMKILEKYGVDPSLLHIELTETAMVTDYANAKKLFSALRERGVKTYMDDFGAGYSMLNIVIDVPVDGVKLDRMFIQQCSMTEKGKYLLQQTMRVIIGLDYQVICEGIETKEQAEYIKEIGGKTGQGFWFSPPVPITEFIEKYL